MCMYYCILWPDFVTLTCQTEKCIIHKHFSLWYIYIYITLWLILAPINLTSQYFSQLKIQLLWFVRYKSGISDEFRSCMWYYSNYKAILKRSKNNCISITHTCLTEKMSKTRASLWSNFIIHICHDLILIVKKTLGSMSVYSCFRKSAS